MQQYYGENQGDMGYEAQQQMGYQIEQQINYQAEETFVKTKEKKRKKKKEEKELQPQCYMSVTNMVTWNYNVYYMSKKQKILYFLLAFIAGGIVGYIFFGGLFKDEFYEPTTATWIANFAIITTTGCIAGKMFLPMRTQQLLLKKKKAVKQQFADLLESLTTSLNAGNNVQDSFQNAYNDLKLQYGESADIVYELSVVLSGIANNFAIEDMLMDLGNRSAIEDIKSFAQIFEISYRKGGNIKDIIRNTQSILGDKMTIEQDIETMMTANKSEINIMILMPVFLVAMMKGSSVDFAANFASITGIISTVIGVIMFIAAYFVGQSIMNIKV